MQQRQKQLKNHRKYICMFVTEKKKGISIKKTHLIAF